MAEKSLTAARHHAPKGSASHRASILTIRQRAKSGLAGVSAQRLAICVEFDITSGNRAQRACNARRASVTLFNSKPVGRRRISTGTALESPLQQRQQRTWEL